MTATREPTVELQSAAPPSADDGARTRWDGVCGRIYWPSGTPAAAPVLDGCCVRCRRPLPGKHAHGAAPA